MNKVKLLMAATIAIMGIGFAVPAFAACNTAAECINEGVKSTGTTGGKTSIGDIVKTVVNILLYIIGAAAVIMIVIGGIRYVVSQGDSNAISSAKNTILYAVIGLAVALMAYAIVNWVIGAFTK